MNYPSMANYILWALSYKWRRLRGFRQLADVIADVRFIGWIDERETGRRAA